ncbi:MAG: MFS transporter, partial [Hyphomicrobiales bacterium]
IPVDTHENSSAHRNPRRAIPTVFRGFPRERARPPVVTAGLMDARANTMIVPRIPGYYSGLLCSGFMMGRFLSSHFWGMVSDCYGRQFVVVVGLVSTMVLSVGFGISTTISWAFSFR